MRDVGELCRLLQLPAEFERRASAAVKDFPLFVPRPFLARIRPADTADPLLRQVLPLEAETLLVEGFTSNPVDDRSATWGAGFLGKYAGRALMVTTGACTVHCRYCFRRHFPYHATPRSLDAWQTAIDQIAADERIHEVILSGGDPLMLVDACSRQMADHFRNPAFTSAPPPHAVANRDSPASQWRRLGWLTGNRLTPIVVVHANHPAEIDEAVAAALRRLIDAGVPVLNQAVLLRGVNDSIDTLAELCERLIDLHVIPCYLHQLDRVAGAALLRCPSHKDARSWRN